MNLRKSITALAVGIALTLGAGSLAMADDVKAPTQTPSASSSTSADPSGTPSTKPSATPSSSAPKPSSTPTARKSLTVSPQTVRPGGTLQLSGEGYAPSTKIQVVVALDASEDPGVSHWVTTGVNGEFGLQVRAPTMPGKYVALVLKPEGGAQAEARFVVSKKIYLKVNPVQASPGEMVMVKAGGLKPGTTVPVVVALADTDDPGTRWYAKVQQDGTIALTVKAPKHTGHYTVMVLRPGSGDPSMDAIQIQTDLYVGLEGGGGTTKPPTTLPKTGN